jgi:ribosomal-protein-alanine N-acetyltransferase
MDTSTQRLDVRFRPMALADIPRVHEIDMLSFSMPWSERSYLFELTENDASLILVAEASRLGMEVELVGMIVIWVILDEAHVATIATHPGFRGQGIGQQLLARGLMAAYERGARLSYLEVRRGNLVAQTMYRRFGYQVVGERPGYYQDNHEDALLMTLHQLQPEELQQVVNRFTHSQRIK